MPKRLHLSSESVEWTAEVTGARVTVQPDVVGGLQPAEEESGGLKPTGYDTPPAALSVTTEKGDRLAVSGADGTFSGAVAVAGDVVWVTVAGEVFAFTVAHGARRARHARDHDALTPPMPATVVRVAVKVGDRVQAGDVLIALEAMKMELPVKSPREGVVRAIHCREGELVQPDHILIELE